MLCFAMPTDLSFFRYEISACLVGSEMCIRDRYFVDYGAAATAVQKEACRAAAAYAAFAATATTAAAAASAAAAAAVLPLSWCCAAAVVTYGHLFSVFLKKDAVLRHASRSFLFSIRDL